MQIKHKMRDWVVKHAEGPHSKTWLATVSFAEASFFPIPPDILLIAILLIKKRRWFFYAFFTTVFSVLGGVFGYVIGAFFFDTVGESLVSIYHLEHEMLVVGEYFSNNAFVAIFLAAFTPIPFKVFTITAGVFKIKILVLIVASILGRGTRFFIISYMLRKYGKHIEGFIYKYFNIFSLVVAVFIVGIILISVLG